MKKNACRPAYIRPPRLREGDRTALIATASPASEKQLAEAVPLSQRTESLSRRISLLPRAEGIPVGRRPPARP